MSARHFARAFCVLVPAMIALSMGGCPFFRTQQAAAPVFDPLGGLFKGSVTVSMTSATDGAIIYYTMDGSAPDESNGTAYTDKITLTQTTTLNAVAYKDGMNPSPMAFTTFTIDSSQGHVVPPVISNATVTGALTANYSGVVRVSCTITDSDGSVVSAKADLSAIGGPSAQALTKGSNDDWSWSGNVVPPSGGTKTIIFTAKDDAGTPATATATIDVADGNGGPVVSDASATGFLYVDEARPLRLSATVADSDGTVMSMTADLSAVGGSDAQALVQGQDNIWTWSGSVTAAASGTQTIIFKAVDDLGDTGEMAVSIDVGDARPTVGTLRGSLYTGDAINGAPALGADGTVYAVSYANGTLFAVNPEGGEQWAFSSFDTVRRSPTVGQDGTIYISGLGGIIYAVNPDGTEAGTVDVGEALSAAPALGVDGTVYVGTLDGNFYAFNPDGTQAWAFSGGNAFEAEAAVGADGTVYVGCRDHRLYAVNPDGSPKWEYKTADQIQGAPGIGADGTIYIGCDDGNLYAITAGGSLQWTFATGGAVRAAPSIAADGTIYAGSLDQSLYAINPDGSMKWQFSTGGQVWSTPAVGSDGLIYFGSDDDVLYALNPDGSENWAFTEATDDVASSPVISADGTLYVGSWDGSIYGVYVSGELADSPWPMFQRDPTHAGNVRIP